IDRLIAGGEGEGAEDGATANGRTPSGTHGRIGRLIKSHSCTVRYADGTLGTCRYTRGGPAWHLFQYEHTGIDGRTTHLPVQYGTERMGNTLPVIEEIAHERAETAFTAAIAREQKEHFQRATPPAGWEEDACPNGAAAASADDEPGAKPGRALCTLRTHR